MVVQFNISYVIRIGNRMYSYAIRMSLVCTRMLFVCHSYVLVCHSYVTRIYSYAILVSLVCTRMSPVCHSYVALPWTLKDDSESISDLNIDLQFNRLTCETNDSIKQIGGENNRVIYDSNKINDNNNDNNSSEQRNDADTDFAIIQMKELIGNVKNLQTTYQDVFNISDTFKGYWK